MIRTEYTIVATVKTVDTRAAADACNRSLMASGDNFDRAAAEQQIAECHPSLRDWLAIESAEIEIWHAWEDGAEGDKVEFLVPLDGAAHDVAALGASALGVDVSETLNVERA